MDDIDKLFESAFNSTEYDSIFHLIEDLEALTSIVVSKAQLDKQNEKININEFEKYVRQALNACFRIKGESLFDLFENLSEQDRKIYSNSRTCYFTPYKDIIEALEHPTEVDEDLCQFRIERMIENSDGCSARGIRSDYKSYFREPIIDSVLDDLSESINDYDEEEEDD